MSGRLLFCLLAILAACRPVGVTEEPPEPAGPLEPVLREGDVSPARQARAAELFRQAERAFRDARHGNAVELATRVVEDFPASAVSGRALRLLAEAALAAGDWELADTAAERYAGLLGAGDPRRAEMRLLQAEAMSELPDPAARMDRLLRIHADAPEPLTARAVALAREAVRELSLAELQELSERVADARAASPVLRAWLARLLLAEGRGGEARDAARLALTLGAEGPDSLLAEAVLDPDAGDLPDVPGRRILRMGSVLPLTGSPALRELAELVGEGVEVAAASMADTAGLQVELDARDDAGDPGQVAALVSELEESGALGAVGFLRDAALDAAADARRGGFPLVSPTAHVGPDAGPGVLSLAGADPVAASAVAAYAADQGYARVALIHSRVPESVEEARAVRTTLEERGVPVVGSYAYDAGATFFQDQIRAAREVLRMQEIRALGLTEDDTLRVEELDRVALFVPIPAEDVEYVAPQLTFFGLDTLGVEIYGTSGWTDAETLEVVDERHTDGVVAATPVSAGPGSSGYARFREAYEDHFQRTLVSPVPALGWDAALLLLEAARSGARTPRQLQEALAGIRDLEGATGIFSVVDGRVLRRQEVVRILDGATIPAN